MEYRDITRGRFLERPNRFIARVEIQDGQDGEPQVETVHVKNTGRCRELLQKGACVYLEKSGNPARSTAYDLVAVEKGERLVNMDSQAPNQAAWEWLCQKHAPFTDITDIRREVSYHASRFDLSFRQKDRPAFMEVKGVTLEENGIARFPDAPTERGIKHLQELEKAAKDGYSCYLLLVIAMKNIRLFEPNMAAHPQFGTALSHAAAHGVTIMARDCIVTSDSLTLDAPVPVRLPET